VLNGGKQSLFQPFSILFILYSSQELIRRLEGQCVFLEPLIQIKVAFFDGFEVFLHTSQTTFEIASNIDVVDWGLSNSMSSRSIQSGWLTCLLT
jgi:hypothetical protein